MSVAIDINSTSHYWQQYDAAAPDYTEAREAAVADYVDDWIKGNLVETGDSRIYSEPMERLAENDWLVQLLRAKDDDELLQAARIVKAKLRQFVEEQAGEA